MKPLTIEELKALQVGDWVWVKVFTPRCYDHKTGYMKIKDFNEYACVCISFETLISDEAVFDWIYYDKEWIAYKNKEQAECKGEIVELP